MVGYCSAKVLDFGIGVFWFDRDVIILRNNGRAQIVKGLKDQLLSEHRTPGSKIEEKAIQGNGSSARSLP